VLDYIQLRSLGGIVITIQLEALHSSLRELNHQLDLLDRKISKLEVIFDDELFGVFLLANQLDITLTVPFEDEALIQYNYHK